MKSAIKAAMKFTVTEAMKITAKAATKAYVIAHSTSSHQKLDDSERGYHDRDRSLTAAARTPSTIPKAVNAPPTIATREAAYTYHLCRFS